MMRLLELRGEVGVVGGRVMGGSAGARGYLVQALISVLDTIGEDSQWFAVSVEPKAESEKVDIIWYYPGGQKRATQVKSSENQFNLRSARSWAEELRVSTQAETCELILVGPCSEGLAKAQKTGLSGVFLRIKNLELDGLIAEAAHRLDNYLAAKGIVGLGSVQREMLVRTLVTDHTLLSTDGVVVPREEFDRRLTRWAREFRPVEAARGLAPVIKLLRRGPPEFHIANGVWSNPVPPRGFFLSFPLYIDNATGTDGSLVQVEAISIELERPSDLIQFSLPQRCFWRRKDKRIAEPLQIKHDERWTQDLAIGLPFRLTEDDPEHLARRLKELESPFLAEFRYLYTGTGGDLEGSLKIAGSLAPIRAAFRSNWYGTTFDFLLALDD